MQYGSGFSFQNTPEVDGWLDLGGLSKVLQKKYALLIFTKPLLGKSVILGVDTPFLKKTLTYGRCTAMKFSQLTE